MMVELKYDITQIRESSSKCAAIADVVKFNTGKLSASNKKSFGTVKDEVDDIINDMSGCATDTQAFLKNAVAFISNIAKHFEDMDTEVAREVRNS